MLGDEYELAECRTPESIVDRSVRSWKSVYDSATSLAHAEMIVLNDDEMSVVRSDATVIIL